MRCNWQRWLWGLIPLVMVSWVAVQVERDAIEKDLTERSKQALAAGGLPWAGVELNGRDIVLVGRALKEEEPPKAEETLRRLWGVRDVENRAILPPKVEPFLWAARRRGNRIRLMGYVPDRATRHTVIGLTKAAMPGLDVVDRMNIARGVPPGDAWLAGLSFALKQLSAMKHGDVRLEDLTLSIAGEAEDPAAFKSLNAAMKSAMPKGVKIANAQIAAPVVSPFTWSAQLGGGQLVLAGYVAGGDSARAGLVAAARSAAPGVHVVDRMEPAEGAPPGWIGAAGAIVKELARLENGLVEMRDAVFTVSGVAPDETQARSARAAVHAASPAGYKLVDQISAREAAKVPEPAPIVPVQPAPTTPKQSQALPPVPAAPAPNTAAAPSLPPPTEPTLKQASPAPADPVLKQATPAQPSAPASKGPAEVPPPAAPAALAPAPAVSACQDTLSRIATAGHILFATDSASLDASSLDTLDRLAVAAKTCPGMRIAIEGHTDAEGSSDYNQRLSVRRAQAVVAYLVKAGADRRQLEAVGYGVSRPAAPNDTPQNMARNRRIEFSVRQQ